MNINDLMVHFKRYALYEKGMIPLSFKAIQSTVLKLSSFAESTYLKDLSEGVIRDFLYKGKEQLGWSPRTFRNQRQYLNSFFSWCQQRGYCNKNPVFQIHKPKIPKALPRFLDRNEIQKVIAQTTLYSWCSDFERIRNEAIIYTFLYSGIRQKELLRLRVINVNLEEGHLFVIQGKGKKDRFVPIHPSLSIRLRTYLNYRRKNNKCSEWLFTGLHSEKALWPNDVLRICKKISIASGVKFTPHKLRHTMARMSIEANLNPYKLKEILGHSDISTTMIYASASTKCIQDSFSSLKLL